MASRQAGAREGNNPLSPTLFLRRNLGKTIPLTFVIMLAVMLVAGVIALIDSIPFSIRTIYSYTKESLGVSPRGDSSYLPKLISIIQRESPVPIERVATCRVSSSQVQSVVGKWPFVVLGLGQDDMRYFLKRQGVTSIEGRLPQPGMPEAIISDPVAQNLHFHVGSILQAPDNPDSYSQLQVKVVGIAHTDRWLMINPIEYQRLYHFPPIDLAMVFARNRADQEKLDLWAEKRFEGQRAQLFTYDKVDSDSQKMFETLFKIINVVVAMLVLVITFMMAMLINIYQTQRLVEYGLLQAIGYTRAKLVWRGIAENVTLVAVGWVLGLGAAFGLLEALDAILMRPHAYAMQVTDIGPYRYTIPIPFAILIAAIGTVAVRFRKFDPVAVVERRLL